jgi:hypothetical protein
LLRATGSQRLRSCLCFISANKLAPKSKEHARCIEAAGMTRRDANLCCDLGERHAESLKAMNRQ